MPQLSTTITYSNSQLVVAGGYLYYCTSDANLQRIAGDGTVSASFAHGLAGAPSNTGASLASDGEYWYITDGATIRRNNTNADPAANWSTEDVTKIAWCVDRLMGIDTAASPDELISFSPTGTGTVVVSHVDKTLTGICGGNGYVWYGVNTGSYGGFVAYWQVDSSPTNLGTAFVLPEGEIVRSLYFYQGNVFVSAHDVQRGEQIYRCIPDSDGTLTPQRIGPKDRLDGLAKFAGTGKYVAFSWFNMDDDGTDGIGVIDLETGGFARWHVSTTTASSGIWVAAWQDDFAFMHGTLGVFGRDSGDHTSPTYRNGYVETSTTDLGTPALKHLDEILLSTLPLPAGTSVAVAYSIDGGANYTTAATFDTDGDTQHSVELATAVVASAFRFKATLTSSTSVKPTVTALVAKTHATGIVDEILELPINCEDTIADVNNTVIAADSGPGKGMARYRALRALIGTKVTFQDVDWTTTQSTPLWEVVGVESTLVNVFNQTRNLSDQTGHVAVVSLRRPYTA